MWDNDPGGGFPVTPEYPPGIEVIFPDNKSHYVRLGGRRANTSIKDVLRSIRFDILPEHMMTLHKHPHSEFGGDCTFETAATTKAHMIDRIIIRVRKPVMSFDVFAESDYGKILGFAMLFTSYEDGKEKIGIHVARRRLSAHAKKNFCASELDLMEEPTSIVKNYDDLSEKFWYLYTKYCSEGYVFVDSLDPCHVRFISDVLDKDFQKRNAQMRAIRTVCDLTENLHYGLTTTPQRVPIKHKYKTGTYLEEIDRLARNHLLI